MGDRCHISDFTVVFAQGGVEIGDDVLISANCTIASATHPVDADDRATHRVVAKPIRIHDRAWLGAGVILLPGVTVGEGAVIGAGSVVTRDVPAGRVVKGNPAR